MLWLRMLGVAVRLAWPHLLTPWRSPLLRWRMETFGIRQNGRLLTAASIDRKAFIRFCVTERRSLIRFLRWAATLGIRR